VMRATGDSTTPRSRSSIHRALLVAPVPPHHWTSLHLSERRGLTRAASKLVSRDRIARHRTGGDSG
jgi:hypothetical protein